MGLVTSHAGEKFPDYGAIIDKVRESGVVQLCGITSDKGLSFASPVTPKEYKLAFELVEKYWPTQADYDAFDHPPAVTPDPVLPMPQPAEPEPQPEPERTPEPHEVEDGTTADVDGTNVVESNHETPAEQ